MDQLPSCTGIINQRPASRLRISLGAPGGRSEEARSLARLEFARSLGQNGRLGIGFNLASLLNTAGLEIEQSPPESVQLPLWSETFYNDRRL